MTDHSIKIGDKIYHYRCLHEEGQVYDFKLPFLIEQELNDWTDICRGVKDHPLADLKAHHNAGYLGADNIKHNSYQCSVPPNNIDTSYFLPFILRIVTAAFGGKDRDYRLRRWPGHYGHYDMWANFAYKGDDNPVHNHSGYVSGVIYVENDDTPTCFKDLDIQYAGRHGDVIMFPSKTMHYVTEKQTECERVTYAFNIERPG